MRSYLKLFFAVSACAVIFAACNKNAGGANVKGPKDGSRGAAKPTGQPTGTPAGKNEISTAKMTSAQKTELEAVAKDMKAIRPLFRDSDLLWQEFWGKIIAPESAKQQNAFKLVYQILEANFSDRGIPLDKTKNKTACSLGETEVKKVDANTFHVMYAVCGRPNEKQNIAILSRNTGGWTVEFHIAQFEGKDGKSDQMMGNFMKLLKSDLGSQCDLKPLPLGRLGALTCENLGQDISASKYALIKTLKFKHPMTAKGDETPLELEFSLFEVTGEKEKEYQGKAFDNKVKKEFLVDLMEKAPPEAKNEAADKALAAQAEEQARKEKEEKDRSEREQQNSDQNQNQNQNQQAQSAAKPAGGAAASAGVQTQQPQDPQYQHIIQDPNSQQQNPQQDQQQQEEVPHQGVT